MLWRENRWYRGQANLCTLWEGGQKKMLKRKGNGWNSGATYNGLCQCLREESCSAKHPSPSSSIFTTKITSNSYYLVGVPSNDPSLNTSYKDFVRLIKQISYKPVISVRCRQSYGLITLKCLFRGFPDPILHRSSLRRNPTATPWAGPRAVPEERQHRSLEHHLSLPWRRWYISSVPAQGTADSSHPALTSYRPGPDAF